MSVGAALEEAYRSYSEEALEWVSGKSDREDRLLNRLQRTDERRKKFFLRLTEAEGLKEDEGPDAS